LDVIIIVPTYWTWGSDRPDGPVQARFDHPTPVDGESTLPRLLDCLRQMDGPPFSVLVLTATVHPNLEGAAEERVSGIIAPFRERFPIAQFSAIDLASVHGRLRSMQQEEMVPFLSLSSYPGVRNCQLVVPHLLGAEVIIALDDDEVVPSNYLPAALQFVGTEHKGERVLGLAGPYLDADGTIALAELPRSGNIFLDKSAIMNEGTQALQNAPGRLVRTPVALGGNMVFHRELFTQVSFDPWITRGEDIDYLINARMQAYPFWFDKQLVITHLPPEAYPPLPYAKLSQDVIRFVYERQKLKHAGVDPAQFDPYPGRFLRDDVEAQALVALQQMATPAEVARLGSPEEILAQAQRRAQEAPARFFTLAQRWPQWMEALAGDRLLREHWQAKL